MSTDTICCTLLVMQVLLLNWFVLCIHICNDTDFKKYIYLMAQHPNSPKLEKNITWHKSLTYSYTPFFTKWVLLFKPFQSQLCKKIPHQLRDHDHIQTIAISNYLLSHSTLPLIHRALMTTSLDHSQFKVTIAHEEHTLMCRCRLCGWIHRMVTIKIH